MARKTYNPSETPASRAKRGKPTVSLSLTTEALEILDAMAAKQGITRSAAVVALILEKRPRP